MRTFPISPVEIGISFWRNRNLIKTSVKREIASRYRGSFLGVLWSFFNPLFMLAVYTFVFSVVFKARWGEGGGSKTEFALVLFAGLIVFNLFSECFTRAPTLILANVNYVKKVVYPLEILPWVLLGSAFFNAVLSLTVWLVAYCLFYGWPHLSILYLPLIWIPLCLLSLGASWALASLGVFLRDTAQITSILATVLMFLSPIFYPITALPEAYRPLLSCNPLMPAIEQTRAVLYWGAAPNWPLLLGHFAVAALIAWLGFAWFQKTRKGFADVL